MSVYFLNGPTPASFCLFSVFTNNTIFTANQCEKCPTSIWRRDSNPRPLEHESSPTTTRLGLPPLCRFIIITQMILIYFISGCITVPSTADRQFYLFAFSWIAYFKISSSLLVRLYQTSQIGQQLYNDTSTYKVSIHWLIFDTITFVQLIRG